MTALQASILSFVMLFQGKTPATGDSQRPIPICEVLENLRAYDGQTIVVRAGWNGSLVGDCKPPQSPDDPRYPLPGELLVNAILVAPLPVNAEQVEPFKTPLQQFDRLWKEGYDVFATFVGRLQVKRPGGFGFGHLGGYSAQISVMGIKDVTPGKKGKRRKLEWIEK